ncbi:glycosyltransferase [Shewanella dokdonensis]|uniref:Glycosyltransferase n=1 Tax=Shewanella dokdonensis TaxID=712036 RepID=A0ABX8DH11_9GAMM|nr:glycosyltransferase [Shewanella dokdonensis]QVK23675.1 glycosyltransferase [Shewanella dokdonensis]
MNCDLSICIPSLNRANYLAEALHSIVEQDHYGLDIEICISNNASDEDYREVEDFICNYTSNNYHIKYVKQGERISLDEHMHYVANMASGEYIYYLGDDDYFYDDAFKTLFELIKVDGVDIAIFNGTPVDADGHTISSGRECELRRFTDIDNAFLNLKGKSTFGAVLFKRDYLNDEYFSSLYGGCHAYTSFWLPLLNRDNRHVLIVMPKDPVVYLRMAVKNYKVAAVYYHSIPYHLQSFRHLVVNKDSLVLVNKIIKQVETRNGSIKFMCSLMRKDVLFSDIPTISISMYIKMYCISFINQFYLFKS